MASPVKYPPHGSRFGLADPGCIESTLRNLRQGLSQDSSWTQPGDEGFLDFIPGLIVSLELAG